MEALHDSRVKRHFLIHGDLSAVEVLSMLRMLDSLQEWFGGGGDAITACGGVEVVKFILEGLVLFSEGSRM